MTPDMVPTPLHPARGRPGGRAVDLGPIRRTDAIIDLIASRRLLRPHALGDPAAALLSSLAADVDAAIGAGIAAAVRSALGQQRAGRRPGRHRRQARPLVITVAATMMVSVAAAVATTGLLVVSMLSRLGGRGSGPGGQRPGR